MCVESCRDLPVHKDVVVNNPACDIGRVVVYHNPSTLAQPARSVWTGQVLIQGHFINHVCPSLSLCYIMFTFWVVVIKTAGIVLPGVQFHRPLGLEVLLGITSPTEMVCREDKSIYCKADE